MHTGWSWWFDSWNYALTLIQLFHCLPIVISGSPELNSSKSSPIPPWPGRPVHVCSSHKCMLSAGGGYRLCSPINTINVHHVVAVANYELQNSTENNLLPHLLLGPSSLQVSVVSQLTPSCGSLDVTKGQTTARRQLSPSTSSRFCRQPRLYGDRLELFSCVVLPFRTADDIKLRSNGGNWFLSGNSPKTFCKLINFHLYYKCIFIRR